VAQPQNSNPDPERAAVGDYVLDFDDCSDTAVSTAHLALFDFPGCALAGLDEADCRRVIRPIVPQALDVFRQHYFGHSADAQKPPWMGGLVFRCKFPCSF